MAKNKPEPRLKKHHWLVSGKVLFIRGEQTEAGSFEHNTVVTNDKLFVTANMIGHAQQLIQMHLFEQCPDPSMKIMNVHVQGISYLGCMTQDEFYTPPPADENEAAPAGELAEVADNDPFALKGPTLN